MKLSKCSIEFEFYAEGGFDEVEEISVPVRIPEEIEHGLYGHPTSTSSHSLNSVGGC